MTTLTQLLCPFGIFPHWRGDQLIDKESGLSLKKSIYSKLFHRLKPIPIFSNGHADDISDDPSYLKQSTVGFVKELFMDDQNGIIVKCEYDYTGIEMIKHFHYSMSPRWRVEKLIINHQIFYRPIKLYSIGLTLKPNIEVSGKILW